MSNEPPWWVPLVAYSVPAAGAVAAVVILAIGGVVAPILGFVIRPVRVAITYRLTSRERQAGEEQWPPSLFGANMEAWPRPPSTSTPAPTPTPTPACRNVPGLVGQTVLAARGAWSAAGFTGLLNPTNGHDNATVLTQSESPGACLPPSSSITVTYTKGPG